MKKSDQSLNKALTRGSIRRLFTVPMIICLVVFSLNFITSVFIDTSLYDIYYPTESLINILREEARCIIKSPAYEPSYCLSASYLTPKPFLFGAILAALQFNFLLSKKSCYTQLSFAVDRKRLFNIKTLVPLSIPLAVIILTNVVAFILNAVYIGISVNLFAGVALSILTPILYLLIGYTATVAGHLFTARRIEAYIFTLSLLNIGSTITSMLAFVFPHTIYGYADELTSLALFDEEFVTPDLYYDVNYFPVNGPTHFASSITLYSVALLVLVGILVLFKQYFVKRYKVEQSGIRGKSRVALVISCVVPALYIVHSFSMVSSYLYYDEISFTAGFVACIIVSVILCLLICLIATFSPKKLLWGATAAGVSLVIHLLILAIGLTGGFGYDTRIPDKDKIVSVNISVPFEEPTYDNEYFYSENQYFLGEDMYSSSTIELSTEKDIDIALDIHKSLIDNREEETGTCINIYYTLEDGTIIQRYYENISYTAAEKTFRLWETDKNRMNLRFLLNQDTKEDQAYLNNYDYLMDEEAMSGMAESLESSLVLDEYIVARAPEPLSTFTNTYLISKDSNVTVLDITSDEDISANYTDEVALEIMGAIYKDASNLSAEEWFNADNNLGALGFCSNIANTDTDVSFEFYDTVFYINANMDNTISVLEKYGYLKYFDCKKEIEEAHIIDVDEVCAWLQAYYDVYETPVKHGIYFSQTNSDIEEYLVSGCAYLSPSDAYYDEEYDDEYYYVDDDYYDDYYDEYYDEIVSDYGEVKLNPQELHNKKEIKSLFNKAHFAHKTTGEGDKFLVIKYTDDTCSMLLLPG